MVRGVWISALWEGLRALWTWPWTFAGESHRYGQLVLLDPSLQKDRLCLGLDICVVLERFHVWGRKVPR